MQVDHRVPQRHLERSTGIGPVGLFLSCRGDECRHLARHGSEPTACGGSAPLGGMHGPVLVLRHDLRPASPSNSVGDRSLAISDQAFICWWRSKPHEPSPWEGRAEAVRRSGRCFKCRDIRVTHGAASGHDPPPSARPTWSRTNAAATTVAAIKYEGEIITHAPSVDVRAAMAFCYKNHGCRMHGALDPSPPSAMERRGCRVAFLQARPLAVRIARRSPGITSAVAVWLDREPAMPSAWLGGWPCGWITAPSICRTTSPTRSSSGASSRPGLLAGYHDQRCRSPSGRQSRHAGKSAAGSSMAASTSNMGASSGLRHRRESSKPWSTMPRGWSTRTADRLIRRSDAFVRHGHASARPMANQEGTAYNGQTCCPTIRYSGFNYTATWRDVPCAPVMFTVPTDGGMFWSRW